MKNILKLAILGLAIVGYPAASYSNPTYENHIISAAITTAKRNSNASDGVKTIYQKIVQSNPNYSSTDIINKINQHPATEKTKLVNALSLIDKEYILEDLVMTLLDDNDKTAFKTHIGAFIYMFENGHTNPYYKKVIGEIRPLQNKSGMLNIKECTMLGTKLLGAGAVQKRIQALIQAKKMNPLIMLQVVNRKIK